MCQNPKKRSAGSAVKMWILLYLYRIIWSCRNKLNKMHGAVCPVVSYVKAIRKLQSMQCVSGTVKMHLSKTDEFDYQIRLNSSACD